MDGWTVRWMGGQYGGRVDSRMGGWKGEIIFDK